jgi:hypothetical protein
MFKRLSLLGIGCVFLSSCLHFQTIDEIEPYKLIYKLNHDGLFCAQKSARSAELICRSAEEIAMDPIWKDEGVLIHNRNLKEKLIKLLDKMKELSIEVI